MRYSKDLVCIDGIFRIPFVFTKILKLLCRIWDGSRMNLENGINICKGKMILFLWHIFIWIRPKGLKEI